MKRFIILAFVLVSMAVPSHGQGLEDLIATAEANNPGLKASLARYEALKARSERFGYLEDPKLSAGYFLQSVETRVGPQRATVSLSQMFPWFGTLDAKEQSAAYMAEAAYRQYEDERNRLIYRLTSVYNSMYAVTKSGDAVEEHATWLAAFKDILTSRYENGRAGLSDVLRVEMELRQLENKRQQLADKLQTLGERLTEFTGGEVVANIRFPDTLQAPGFIDEDDVRNAVQNRNPLLSKYDLMRDSWDQSARAARNSGLPSFTLGATYTVIDGRDDVVLSDNGKDAIIAPQVGISLPIYRGKYSAMEDEALMQKEAVNAEKAAMALKLQSDAAEALEAVRNAGRDVELYRGLSELSQKTRDIILTEYTTAASNIDDVIQVERQYIEYQLKLEEARASYSTSAAKIDYLTGKRGMNNE